MKVLVTGPDGFVGRHLCHRLVLAGARVIEAKGPGTEGGIDIRDSGGITALLASTAPDAIVHLAAVSSVGKSHEDPIETFDVNVMGTASLLSAARRVVPGARLLFVGPAVHLAGADEPAREDMALGPLSPYAASKAAAEMLALQFHRSYATDVVCVRAFNHLGRGQAQDFAVPSFAAQLASIRRGETPAVVHVGDLTPVRDFLHVEDVVAAYELLLQKGRAGEIYNVASGKPRSIRSLLEEMIAVAGIEARVETDPSKLRPVDIPILVGDPARLTSLGWSPRREVREALRDALEEQGALRSS